MRYDTHHYADTRKAWWHDYLAGSHNVRLESGEVTTDAEIMRFIAKDQDELLIALTAPPFQTETCMSLISVLSTSMECSPLQSACMLAVHDWELERTLGCVSMLAMPVKDLMKTAIATVRARSPRAFTSPDEGAWECFVADMGIPQWTQTMAHHRACIVRSQTDWKFRFTRHTKPVVSNLGRPPLPDGLQRKKEDVASLLMNTKYHRAFFIIKPRHEATQSWTVHEIITWMEARGYLVRVFNGKRQLLSPEQVDAIYAEHVGKTWYEEAGGQKEYMTSAAVVCGMAVFLPHPVQSAEMLRRDLGSTEPDTRHPLSLRGMFAAGRMRENVLHVADPEDTERQISLLTSWLTDGSLDCDPDILPTHSPLKHTGLAFH